MIVGKEIIVTITPEYILAAATLVTAVASLVWSLRRSR